MLRIGLFLLTNLAVMALLFIVASLFGFNDFRSSQGLDLSSLLGFSAIFGFGGAFFSLAISKWMAKRSMGVQVIHSASNETERWLLNTVSNLSKKANIAMPEVGVFMSPTSNAFATGMRRDDALVAVSTGLLQSMTEDEIEAVLAHEVAHVANGDMVTMGLLQGVLNTFVIFFARIIGYAVDRWLNSSNQSSSGGIGYFIASFIAEIVLGIFASMIAMWFSRYREFRADEGGAQLAGKAKMIAALQRLKSSHQADNELPNEMAAFGFGGNFSSLLASHPPLDDRIAALQRAV